MSDSSHREHKEFTPVHFSFSQGPDYWRSKGSDIGKAIVNQLRTARTVDRPVILPARKKTTEGRTFSELIAASKRQSPEDYYVSTDEPVVGGFVEQFFVPRFEDLPNSPLLISLGIKPMVEVIYDADQYTEDEKNALTGGLYLPAVRVQFLPIESETV